LNYYRRREEGDVTAGSSEVAEGRHFSNSWYVADCRESLCKEKEPD
jgi:hypothetical protein